jgi:CubicO group peptidase (beta-lactamase class C family)
VAPLEDLIASWPVALAAAGVTDREATLWTAGDVGWAPRIASVSKLFAGICALIAIEELSLSLETPAGPAGSTVRHLLAHASGLPFDGDTVIARPGTRRIYSNTGIEVFCRHLEARTAMPYGEYLRSGVLEPLGLASTSLDGSPASGMHGSVEDLLAFGRELLSPTLVAENTLDLGTQSHFPELKGVVPELGSFDPCPWGLTFELKHGKVPHWTGTHNSWDTFGHFGGSGSFLWVDSDAGLACAVLTDTTFGPWALDVWPPFSDAVLAAYSRRG